MSDSTGSDIKNIDKEFGKQLYFWEVHPIKRDKKKTVLFLIVTFVFIFFLIEITKSLLLSYLVFLIYLFTLKGFIFKTYYRLYEKGLVVVQLGFNDRRWYSSFKSIFESGDSLLLSALKTKKYSLRVKTRGMELVFDNLMLRNRVLSFLEGKIAESDRG